MSQSVLHSCDYVHLVVVVDKKESGGELVPGKIRVRREDSNDAAINSLVQP
jgi:hypothetical protein